MTEAGGAASQGSLLWQSLQRLEEEIKKKPCSVAIVNVI